MSEKINPQKYVERFDDLLKNLVTSNSESHEIDDAFKQHVDHFSSLLDTKEYRVLLLAISSIDSVYYRHSESRPRLITVLLNAGFVRQLSEVLYKLDYLNPTSDKTVYRTYSAALSLSWNLSDADFKFASEMVRLNIGQLMMRNVMQKLYHAKLDKSDSEGCYIIKSSLSTINNMTRFPGHRDVFDTVIFKDTLVWLSHVEDEFIQALACLCLANLINENESHLLENASKATQFLIKTVKYARQSDDGRYRGFTALEMIQGLRALSSNDLAKHKIVEAGCLTFIELILGESEADDEEISEITSILWNLSFDDNLKERIKNSAVISAALKRMLAKSSNSDIRKNVKGILSRCEGTDAMMLKIDIAKAECESEPPHPQGVSPPPKYEESANLAGDQFKFHVFMSYCQRNSDKVYPIVDELKKNKIKVWLDRDQIDGSTLESMADGIDDSKIILIGMSEGYKDSPNCRTEAEYAHYLKKPIIPLIIDPNYKPKGWLGMMLGTKLYYDFGGLKPFNEMSQRLVEAIKKKL